MDVKEIADAVMGALETALEARLARRGDMVSTDGSLLSLVREARNPEAAQGVRSAFASAAVGAPAAGVSEIESAL